MRNVIDKLEGNSAVVKKVRKRAICNKVGKCDRCPWHDKENRGRRARDDRGKNPRRR